MVMAMDTVTAGVGTDVSRRPESFPRRPIWQALAAASLTLASASVAAQGVTVAKTLSVSETFTDNVGAAENGTAGSDWITQISPGIAISRRSGRLSGSLSASVNGQLYANDSSRNTSYLQLASNGAFVAVDDLLFVDFGASIKRENVSAFSSGTLGDEFNSTNQSLVRRFFLAPRLAFRVGKDINGGVSYRQEWTSGGGSVLDNRNQRTIALSLSNPLAFGPFGWDLNFQDKDSDSGGTMRSVSSQTATATLIYAVSPQLKLRLIGGHERNDYSVGEDVSRSFSGGGVDWQPNSRTNLSATAENRFFGTAYNVSFTHRMPLSSFDLGYVRDVASTETTAFVSAADLLYPTIYGSLGSITDPAEREAAARALAVLLGSGVPPIGFLTNTDFIDRSAWFGFAINGARNTLAFRASRSERSALSPDLALVSSDDLSAYSKTVTKASSISLQHRLSALSSLTVSYSYSDAKGEGTTTQDVRRRALTGGFSTKLSPRTSVSLVLRHQSASGSYDYTENALVASVSTRF